MEPVDMQVLSKKGLSLAIEDLEAKLSRSETEETSLMACKKLMDMAAILQEKDISIHRLQQMMFGKKTEKEKKSNPSGETAGVQQDTLQPSPEKKKRKSRTSGRLTASDYKDASSISCPHGTLKPGDICPECEKGKVYRFPQAEEIIIEGQALFKATLLELERLRCNACGHLFTADRPDWAPPGKYDEKAKALTLLLKYGYGMPFWRLEKLQKHLKTPYPASTQWDQISGLTHLIKPIVESMMKEASQGDLFYADDTGVKILSEMNEATRDKQTERKGVQTTVIISEWKGHKAVLFFSGYNHAGDNLGKLLNMREMGLDQPVQITDGHSVNTSHTYAVWAAYCLTHARRYFYEIRNYFPDQCQIVLTLFKTLFKNEATCKEQSFNPKERLLFHQTHSADLMKQMNTWCLNQFKEKKAEPNSSLGKAIKYLLAHWNELTLFLRQEGVPLDNSESERQLKRPIMNRKNAYFFKTLDGAEIGSMCMSLIATCEENEVNPLDYLVFIQKEADRVQHHPERYLPWCMQAGDQGLEIAQEMLRQSSAIPA